MGINLPYPDLLGFPGSCYLPLNEDGLFSTLVLFFFWFPHEGLSLSKR